MSNAYEQAVNEFMAKVIAKNPAELEFHQAVKEVVESILPFVAGGLVVGGALLYFTFIKSD